MFGILQNEDLKRVNDGLKKELARKSFALESLENEVKGEKFIHNVPRS